VEEILACKHAKLRQGWTMDDICQVVETSDKKRFKMEERSASDYCAGDGKLLCIRANQGHSIAGIDPNQLSTRLSADELADIPTIVHGTYKEPWKVIQTKGLCKMGRNHIHFAPGLAKKDGVISGMRNSSEIKIFIDAKKCADNGILFFKSDNGVLLSAGIEGTLPVSYFSHVTDASGKVLLDQRDVRGDEVENDRTKI
jgi:2'-phosphotransferase